MIFFFLIFFLIFFFFFFFRIITGSGFIGAIPTEMGKLLNIVRLFAPTPLFFNLFSFSFSLLFLTFSLPFIHFFLIPELYEIMN